MLFHTWAHEASTKMNMPRLKSAQAATAPATSVITVLKGPLKRFFLVQYAKPEVGVGARLAGIICISTLHQCQARVDVIQHEREGEADGHVCAYQQQCDRYGRARLVTHHAGDNEQFRVT